MKKNEISFEEGMKSLETTIEELEQGDLTLDKALEYFEKGVRVIQSCESHLSKAEGKIKEILAGENGTLVEKILGSSLAAGFGGEAFDE